MDDESKKDKDVEKNADGDLEMTEIPLGEPEGDSEPAEADGSTPVKNSETEKGSVPDTPEDDESDSRAADDAAEAGDAAESDAAESKSDPGTAAGTAEAENTAAENAGGPASESETADTDAENEGSSGDDAGRSPSRADKRRAKKEEKARTRDQKKKEKEEEKARKQEEKQKKSDEKKKAKAEKKEVRKEHRKAFGKKVRRIIAIVLVVAAAAAVAGIAIYSHYRNYFTDHFYSGTTINGTNVSYMTADEVKDSIRRDVEKYTLTINERDGSEEVLPASDIGWSYIDDGKVEELLESQNPARWFSENDTGRSYNVAAGTTYDTDKVKNAVANLKCLDPENTVLPVDATMVEQSDGTYAVLPETEGNEVDEDKLLQAVTAALDSGAAEVDITNPDCYVHPSVTRTDENLNTRVNAWNKFLGINLSYKFGDNTEVINADVIRPYIVDNGENVSLTTDWIKNLVYQWGQKYDTFGLERQFTTHGGQEITVPSGGDYGWVIDKQKTIDDVTESLENGVSGEREPIWLYSAMGWDNGDLTGTYVEVSLSEQHLWCYKDGVCVADTDVVTGTPTADRATTPGCFAIDAKKSPATLGTLDVQGYASPVNYWMPFNGGQGLHDAPWRSSFGGDIYQSNGSHGCVNMPIDAAKTVYDTVSIGTAVVVYDLGS